MFNFGSLSEVVSQAVLSRPRGLPDDEALHRVYGQAKESSRLRSGLRRALLHNPTHP
jgi:hypothetical protein